MKPKINDKGEFVMFPDDLGTSEKVRILYPATIQKVKDMLRVSGGVQTAIKAISGYKLTKEEKQAVLFLGSGNRLVRPF